jgi:hypothetical protein
MVPLPDKSGRCKAGMQFLIPPQLVGEGDRTRPKAEMWWWGFWLSFMM